MRTATNEELTSKELFIKAEGVSDCVKWVEKKLKEEGAGYSPVKLKVELEKYMKKLKYMAEAKELE